MAARETGVIRKFFAGDRQAAEGYVDIARKELGILKEQMSFNNLQVLRRTVQLSDGTIIIVRSIFGQDDVFITVPIIEEESEPETQQVAKKQSRVIDFGGVAMPNPVPYRGVGIVVTTVDGVKSTYVMASDGTVLASEVQNVVGGQTQYVPDIVWNGEGSVNMYVHSAVPANFNHQLTFTVPDDCISPEPPVSPSSMFNARRKAWLLKNSNEFMAALKGNFQPGAVGVTRAELQTGALPASWDYLIKSRYGDSYESFTLADGSHAGRHTKMPIVMSVTTVDTVLSDTSAGFSIQDLDILLIVSTDIGPLLALAGTIVTQRAATFQYVDANGVNQTETVNGTLTQVATHHHNSANALVVTIEFTYANWYVPNNTHIISPNVAPGLESLLPHQFILDRSNLGIGFGGIGFGVGLLWNGVVEGGYTANMSDIEVIEINIFDLHDILGFNSIGFVPAIPVLSNTLVGTAAPLYLQYHNTVLPQYVSNTAQSSTVMNNSGMYGIKQIELCLFGPAPDGQAIGIFTDPTDADGATQIAYYGEASLLFDWAQGKITMLSWNPRKDENGNDAPTIINLPDGVKYHNNNGTLQFTGLADFASGLAAYNCAIGYVWDQPADLWPDVNEYLLAKIALLNSGGGDTVLNEIITQALNLKMK